MHEYEHPLSWRALFRVVTVAVAIIIAWKIGTVVTDVIIALMLASALYPLVMKVNKKVPLVLSLLSVLIAIVVPLLFLAIYYGPTFLIEIREAFTAVAVLLKKFTFFREQILTFDQTDYIGRNIAIFSSIALSILLHLIVVITLVFYFILDRVRLLSLFLSLFAKKERETIKNMLLELAEVNGKYISGNVLISVVITIVMTLLLFILGIPYALPLGIFAGIMDLLPLVGSTVGAVPSILIAFTISPVKGVIVLIVHVLYQQFENSILAPFIYKKALDISSALSFLAVVVGAGLFGVIGAFIALPIAASVPVVLKYKESFWDSE